MSTQHRRASCAECPSSFELIPPADLTYTEPREKPISDDHIKRIYECDEQHHRNTIYWEKRSTGHVAGAAYNIEEALSDKYINPLRSF
jgi:hypothetical protein